MDVIPENFDSLEEFWGFWDTHSSADYEDLMESVEVEIELISSKMYCAIAKDLLSEVRTQARQQGVSTETLINLWLREKLSVSALTFLYPLKNGVCYPHGVVFEQKAT